MRNAIELTYLSELFRRIEVDAVFDIGANTGQYYKLLRHELDFQGAIISVEPIPEIAASLHAQAARDTNLHVVEAVVSTAPDGSYMEFNRMENSQFSSLLNPSTTTVDTYSTVNRVAQTIHVRSRTLDSLVHQYSAELQFEKPFLKMDTQGSDAEVIRSGLGTIDRWVGFQSELSVTSIYESSVDFRQALSFYEGLGFVIFSLFPTNLGQFPRLIDVDVIMLSAGQCV